MNSISKKELLEVTGISYGQLYRWKREGLIPEEWFVKQSSFTGQETFFPREEILGRIGAILELKDTHSLGELAGLLSGGGDRFVSLERLRGLDAFSGLPFEELAGTLAPEGNPGVRETSFVVAAFAYGLAKISTESGVPPGECVRLIGAGVSLIAGRNPGETVCTLFRSGDGYHICLSDGTGRPAFDGRVYIVGTLPLSDAVSALTAALKGV